MHAWIPLALVDQYHSASSFHAVFNRLTSFGVHFCYSSSSTLVCSYGSQIVVVICYYFRTLDTANQTQGRPSLPMVSSTPFIAVCRCPSPFVIVRRSLLSLPIAVSRCLSLSIAVY